MISNSYFFWWFNFRIGDSDVGDIVMLVTLWWWLIWDVGGRIIMLATFFVVFNRSLTCWIGHQHPESITNISNLSPTHLVSNIRHKHRCYRSKSPTKNSNFGKLFGWVFHDFTITVNDDQSSKMKLVLVWLLTLPLFDHYLGHCWMKLKNFVIWENIFCNKQFLY